MMAWRSYGGARFALEASAPVQRLARQWLGVQGWRRGDPPPGTSRIRLSRHGERLRCEAPALGPTICGSEASVLGDLENWCAVKALKSARYPAAVHAALLIGGARSASSTMLLVGEHASGKTTLGLAASQLGYHLAGDDVVLVDARGRVRALPRPLRVRLPTLRKVGSLGAKIRARGVLDRSEKLVRVDPARLGRPRRRVVRVGDIIFARYRDGAATHLELMGSARAIPAALGHTFSVRERDANTARATLALLDGARCWRFEHGLSPSRAAQRLEQELRG